MSMHLFLGDCPILCCQRRPCRRCCWQIAGKQGGHFLNLVLHSRRGCAAVHEGRCRGEPQQGAGAAGQDKQVHAQNRVSEDGGMGDSSAQIGRSTHNFLHCTALHCTAMQCKEAGRCVAPWSELSEQGR